jgi:hypothetical protein
LHFFFFGVVHWRCAWVSSFCGASEHEIGKCVEKRSLVTGARDAIPVYFLLSLQGGNNSKTTSTYALVSFFVLIKKGTFLFFPRLHKIDRYNLT